jgi:hypothetical protein
MKIVVQLGLAAFLFAFVSCATGIGEWDGGAKGSNATSLREEVRSSLTADNWAIVGDTTQLVAAKAGSGGQRTIATFDFADAPDGATFHLRGSSHHRFNWATFGILGLSMRNQAAAVLTRWYEGWLAAHPRT